MTRPEIDPEILARARAIRDGRTPRTGAPQYGRRPRQRALVTPRQIAVLQLVADGATNDEIGAQLAITIETVKSHVAATLDRLDARNRAHAVAIAYSLGLLEPQKKAYPLGITGGESSNDQPLSMLIHELARPTKEDS